MSETGSKHHTSGPTRGGQISSSFTGVSAPPKASQPTVRVCGLMSPPRAQPIHLLRGSGSQALGRPSREVGRRGNYRKGRSLHAQCRCASSEPSRPFTRRFHQPTVPPCPQQPRTPVSIFLGKTCHQQRGGPAVAQGPGPGETTARGGGDAGFPFRLVEAPGAPGATWGPVRPQACPAVYLPLLVPSALGGPRTAHGLGLRAVYELQQVLHPAMVDHTLPF